MNYNTVANSHNSETPMTIKSNRQIAQEDNVMGWLIILMMVMFVTATCQASQNQATQETQATETK